VGRRRNRVSTDVPKADNAPLRDGPFRHPRGNFRRFSAEIGKSFPFSRCRMTGRRADMIRRRFFLITAFVLSAVAPLSPLPAQGAAASAQLQLARQAISTGDQQVTQAAVDPASTGAQATVLDADDEPSKG